MEILKVGTKVYNGGDIANESYIGVIVKVVTNRWYTIYHVEHDEQISVLEHSLLSPEYKGNHSTRFVTLEAYNRYAELQIKQLTNYIYNTTLTALDNAIKQKTK
jgi:hypothetical protein